MMFWAKYTLHPRSDADKEPFDGFRTMYTAGGQNAGALVHIAGIAGAKLLGDARLGDPFSNDPYETGNQIARRQYVEDMAQYREAKAYQDMGWKTLESPYNPGKSVIPGYKFDHEVDELVKEKQAEIEADLVGEKVGNLLGQLYARNNSAAETRKWIFDLLCDH